MTNRILNPQVDPAFRRIFGNARNKKILIHFLNDMLVFKNSTSPIVDVTFLNPIQDPVIAAKKTSIVDVLCKDQNDNSYIVEMQVADRDDFTKRAQYYAAKAYVRPLEKGQQYSNLKEIIFLAITNFNMFPNKKAYKSDHIILDKETLEHDFKDFSFTILELPKFNKKNIDDLDNMVDKWAFFLKYADGAEHYEGFEKQLRKLISGNEVIHDAYDELSAHNWTVEELGEYEHAEKALLDSSTELEQCVIKAEKRALAKGMEKGKAEGKAEGAENKAVEIAKNMLSQNLDINLISSVTGLSATEIQQLAMSCKEDSIQ